MKKRKVASAKQIRAFKQIKKVEREMAKQGKLPPPEDRFRLFARGIAHVLGLDPATEPNLIEVHLAVMLAELNEYKARANLNALRAQLHYAKTRWQRGDTGNVSRSALDKLQARTLGAIRALEVQLRAMREPSP